MLQPSSDGSVSKLCGKAVVVCDRQQDANRLALVLGES
jgi:hypothetical protein